MINLPSTSKKFIQTNETDIGGASRSTVWATRNMNLFKPGKAQLSPRMFPVATDTVETDLGLPRRIKYFDGKYFIATSVDVYSIGDGMDTYSLTNESDEASGPTAVNDLGVFNNLLWAIESTDIHTYNPSTNSWTDQTISGMTSSSGQEPHVAQAFNSVQKMAISDDENTVILYDTSYAKDATNILTIPDDFVITCMAYNNSNLFIGTYHKQNGEALIFKWDGSGTAAQAEYPTGANKICALEAYGTTVVAMTSAGQLLQFNSGGFSELINLPVYYTEDVYGDTPGNFTQMAKDSIAVDGKIIYIFLGSDLEGDEEYTRDFYAGLWIYDPEVGLYQYTTPTGVVSVEETILTTAVNTSTDVITVTAAPPTGSQVFYDNGGGTTIGGLQDKKMYFAIQATSTTIKLATTLTNALAGTAIDLTGTGNNGQSIYIHSNKDYGQLNNNMSRTCVCVPSSASATPPTQLGLPILWAADLVDDTSTMLGTLARHQENRGSIIFPKIYASDLANTYSSIASRYIGILTDDDKIIVRARAFDDEALNQLQGDEAGGGDVVSRKVDITWTSTTTFTSTDDLSSVVAGDEIEFLSGTGSGYLANVSSISEAGGTYTVTTDEAIDGAVNTDTGECIFSNFKKIGTFTKNYQDYDSITTSNLRGSFIQVKLELRGKFTGVIDLLINNKSWKEQL